MDFFIQARSASDRKRLKRQNPAKAGFFVVCFFGSGLSQKRSEAEFLKKPSAALER
jgi:hypothetical protein